MGDDEDDQDGWADADWDEAFDGADEEQPGWQDQRLELEEPPDDYDPFADGPGPSAAGAAGASGASGKERKRKRVGVEAPAEPPAAAPEADAGAEEEEEEVGFMWGMNIMTGEEVDHSAKASWQQPKAHAKRVELRYGTYAGLQLTNAEVRASHPAPFSAVSPSHAGLQLSAACRSQSIVPEELVSVPALGALAGANGSTELRRGRCRGHR